MNVLGIIAEFNPFHNGHAYLINEAKRLLNADYCIIVMSGDFVQRGEPAIVNKYLRAETAIENGADLVIELPVLSATASAEGFAYGAVSLLNSLNTITHIAFGTEIDNLEIIDNIATSLISETKEVKNTITTLCKGKMNYPAARLQALEEKLLTENDQSIATVLSSPNSILAIEYMKALKRSNSDIIPFPIKRIGASYNDKDTFGQMSSASGIRKFIKNNRNIAACMPDLAYAKLNEAPGFIFDKDVFGILLHTLTHYNQKDLANIADSNEFIGNKIINNYYNYTSYEEMLNILSSKDYTLSRIKRVLIHTLLSITKDFTPTGTYTDYESKYAKILACGNDKLLSLIAKNSSIPIITKLSKDIEQLNETQFKLISLDLLSSRIYNSMVTAKFSTSVQNEFKRNIFPKKKNK